MFNNSSLVLAQSSGGDAAFGAFAIIMMLLFVALAIALLVFQIWGIIDCAMKQPMDSTSKIIWILLMIFLGGLAGAIWLFWGRKNMDKWQGNATPGAPGAGAGQPYGQPGQPYGQQNTGPQSYWQTNQSSPADGTQSGTGSSSYGNSYGSQSYGQNTYGSQGHGSSDYNQQNPGSSSSTYNPGSGNTQ